MIKLNLQLDLKQIFKNDITYIVMFFYAIKEDIKMILTFIIGVLLVVVMLFLFCILRISSEFSRLEEEYEKEISN